MPTAAVLTELTNYLAVHQRSLDEDKPGDAQALHNKKTAQKDLDALKQAITTLLGFIDQLEIYKAKFEKLNDSSQKDSVLENINQVLESYNRFNFASILNSEDDPSTVNAKLTRLLKDEKDENDIIKNIANLSSSKFITNRASRTPQSELDYYGRKALTELNKLHTALSNPLMSQEKKEPDPVLQTTSHAEPPTPSRPPMSSSSPIPSGRQAQRKQVDDLLEDKIDKTKLSVFFAYLENAFSKTNSSGIRELIKKARKMDLTKPGAINEMNTILKEMGRKKTKDDFITRFKESRMGGRRPETIAFYNKIKDDNFDLRTIFAKKDGMNEFFKDIYTLTDKYKKRLKDQQPESPDDSKTPRIE